MMQTWLQQWYGVPHTPQMTEGMQQQLAQMADMFGADFEIAFMKSMIRHHWKAIVSWLCQWYSICNYGPKGAVGVTQ